jgi:hypothetical protein
MKKIICFIPAIMMIAIGSSHAEGNNFYQVPFQDVEIKSYSKIYVDYHFNPHKQVLICKTNDNDVITSVEWVYKDATRKIDLPVKLKDDTLVKDGYLADPVGRMVITNDFASPSNNGSIFVTCEYQNFN